MKPLSFGAAAAIACFAALQLTVPARGETLRIPSPPPSKYLKKLSSMPDLCQTDRAFTSLPNQGRAYCGPTAVANAIIFMDRKGYSKLVPEKGKAKSSQLTLLRALGSEPYMATNEFEGTGPLAVMEGIENYVQSRGYKPQIEWRGWRNGGKFTKGAKLNENWLIRGVIGNSNVILQIGWYDYDPHTGQYIRTGGHYLTMVGYDHSNPRKAHYLIHDPSRRSGTSKVTQKIHLLPLRHGTITRWKAYHERPAQDYFQVHGITIKRSADVAILDGAMRFKMKK